MVYTTLMRLNSYANPINKSSLQRYEKYFSSVTNCFYGKIIWNNHQEVYFSSTPWKNIYYLSLIWKQINSHWLYICLYDSLMSFPFHYFSPPILSLHIFFALFLYSYCVVTHSLILTNFNVSLSLRHIDYSSYLLNGHDKFTQAFNWLHVWDYKNSKENQKRDSRKLQ